MVRSRACSEPYARRSAPQARGWGWVVETVERMPAYFRAIALDYDGTIAVGARPSESVLASIADVRASGRAVVLVTGRIVRDLLAEFPDAARHFDAIVAENGAVVYRAGRERVLARRVSPKLEHELARQGIPLQRGTVILATLASFDTKVREACVWLGLDVQLVRNRDSLMILPAGVSKGTGLEEGLAELGISTHSAIGVGDAENDLALLDACEVGVAVGNAVTSLKEQADLVLEELGAAAVSRLLDKELPRGLPGVWPRRRRIELGIADDGTPVAIPASRLDVCIEGVNGAGKSHLTGLFLERLVQAGYAVCVLDMQGDHGGLGQLRGALTLGGREVLPPPEEVARMVRHRFTSLVLDLSQREPAVRDAYARDVLDQLTETRRECGLPHWIVIEEAHALASPTLARARAEGSLCLVTDHPDWLASSGNQEAEVVLTAEAPGRASLRGLAQNGTRTRFAPHNRETPHLRAPRATGESRLPFDRGFGLRDGRGPIGVHVLSLGELAIELGRVPAVVLQHHAWHRDFSRWVRGVFRDERLAAEIERAEESFRWEEADRFRIAVQEAIDRRYEHALPPSIHRGATEASTQRRLRDVS